MPQWINDCFDQDSQISLRLNLPLSGEVERDLNGLRGIRALIITIWIFLAIQILCVLCYWVATCFSGFGKDKRYMKRKQKKDMKRKQKAQDL